MIKEKCRLCEVKFKIKTPERRQRSILNHLSTHHKEIDQLEFLVKYEDFEIPKCRFCGENRKGRNNRPLRFYSTCKKLECIRKDRALSEETKRKIGEGQRRYLLSLKGTEKNYYNRSKESYWEKYFRENVLEKERLFEKYKIIQEYREGTYSLDFAIFGKDCKIDLEIDGWQHSRRSNIEWDSRRNEFLKKREWKIYRILGKDLKNDFEETRSLFLNFLSSQLTENQNSYFGRIFHYRELEKEKISKRDSEKKLKNEIKKKAIINKVHELLSSEIDFSKFGWVDRASLIIGISPQKVKNWMIRNLKDFYETHCFKKNGSVA